MTTARERNGTSIPTVIQLVPFYGQERTSLVRALDGIFAAADVRGWNRELVLPRAGARAGWAAETKSSGVKIREAPTDGLDEWVTRLVEETPGPMILHSHFTTYDLAAARASAGSDRASCIWHFHTVLGCSPSVLARHVAKLALARKLGVAAIVCASQAMGSALLRRGAPRDRLHVFPSAIDLDAFPTLSRARRSTAREQLGLPAEAVVLLHFGWDWKLKGGDRFLKAIAYLREHGVDAVGLTRSDPSAEQYIRRAGLKGPVRIQAPCEPWEMFGAADALMATSRGEGLPFTVLEALAMGTPVVATDIPGHRLVAEAPLCRVVGPVPGELASAVRSVLARGRDQAEAEARESRDWLAQHFSLSAYAERMLDLYAENIKGI